jgi:hypothetical protein
LAEEFDEKSARGFVEVSVVLDERARRLMVGLRLVSLAVVGSP